MSGSQIPSSVSSSSSSSRSSYRRLDTDTTPSPSSGNKYSGFNPRVLSNRLAIIEASQALAHASKTLSVAAQAMSKAAVSLAAVSGCGEDYDFEEEYSDDIADWVESPEWAKPNYTLPLPNVSGENTYTVDQGYRFAKASETTNEVPLDTFAQPECASKTDSRGIGGHSTCPSSATPSFGVKPFGFQTFGSQEAAPKPTGQNSPTPSGNAAEPLLPDIPTSTDTKPLPEDDSTEWLTPSQNDNDNDEIEPSPGFAVFRPFGAFNPNAASNRPSDPNTVPYLCQTNTPSTVLASSSTYIVLEHGFDILPALCYIAKRQPKTVCLYNYAGLPSTTNAANMLQANTALSVIVPESVKKQDQSAKAISSFNSAQSGILLWPGCKALPTIDGLNRLSKVQLIHLGEPNTMNADTACLNSTIILARSDLPGLQAVENCLSRRTIDVSNNICNQRGPESPLQPLREWLKSRLAKESYARVFYLDWIVQRRKQNPSRGLVEIVRLANQYAEEFLLRGRSRKHGEPVGGQITMPASIIKGEKFGVAVQAGEMLVS